MRFDEGSKVRMGLMMAASSVTGSATMYEYEPVLVSRKGCTFGVGIAAGESKAEGGVVVEC